MFVALKIMQDGLLKIKPYADKKISNALLHSEGNFAWLPTTFNIGNTIAHRFCSV